MNTITKQALVVGVAIAIEVLVLRRLFASLSPGAFWGIFLVAGVLLVLLQYGLSKSRVIRRSIQRHRTQHEPSPSIWTGLESLPVQIMPNVAEPDRNSSTPKDHIPDTALSGEDGIIQKERREL